MTCFLLPSALRLNYFYLTKIINPLNCAIYVILLVPWVCRYQKKSLLPTAYCLTTNLLSSNSNHKPLKICYLYDFVRSLGMSLPYALAFLSALSFELSTTPAFCLLPMQLGYFYLTQVTSPLKCAVYVLLLVLWVFRS